MDDLANCILNKRESIVRGEMGRRDLVIIEAIYKAAATGKRVEVV
jgi:glucose-fructose oxidoreductase